MKLCGLTSWRTFRYVLSYAMTYYYYVFHSLSSSPPIGISEINRDTKTVDIAESF